MPNHENTFVVTYSTDDYTGPERVRLLRSDVFTYWGTVTGALAYWASVTPHNWDAVAIGRSGGRMLRVVCGRTFEPSGYRIDGPWTTEGVLQNG